MMAYEDEYRCLDMVVVGGIKGVRGIIIIIIRLDQVIGWKLIWRSIWRRERAWRREW